MLLDFVHVVALHFTKRHMRFPDVGFQYSSSEDMLYYSLSSSQQQCIPPLYTENH